MNFRTRKRPTGNTLAAILLTVLSSTASASGFQLFEQSVSSLGNAFAGNSAVAEDATTIFFNPAGLTRVPDTQAIAGLHMISPQTTFDNTGSTAATTNFQGNNMLLGTDGGNAGVTAFVPNLYAAHQLTNNLHIGLGINVPFGLKTKYSSDWVGRYQGINSELQTVNINPSLAYKINQMFSVGFGVNAQYAKANLTNAIDFGAAADAQGQCPPPPAGPPSGFCAQALDGRQQLTGDDWGWGYNLGVMMQLTSATRIGLSYRSHIDFDIEGDVRFSVPPPVRPAFPFSTVDISAKLDLPETISLSAYHDATSKLALLADVSWTKWDRFDQLVVKIDNPALPTSVTDFDWDNTFRYSLGANYKAHQEWTFRTGAAYDSSPVPSASKRNVRVPDSDRIWLAFGISHIPNSNFRFDFAYSHLWMRDAHIDNNDGAGHTLVGNYNNSSVDIFSGQMVWSF
jgi:long-chain fatty acid transport protein